VDVRKQFSAVKNKHKYPLLNFKTILDQNTGVRKESLYKDGEARRHCQEFQQRGDRSLEFRSLVAWSVWSLEETGDLSRIGASEETQVVGGDASTRVGGAEEMREESDASTRGAKRWVMA
jgi:hypothetical protein